MNIVSFYAPRPDHPLFQDYTPYLDLLRASCERFGHRHIVITDDESISDGFCLKLPRSLMRAILAGQLAYLRTDHAKEDTIFVGADCVLANDPQDIAAMDCDIAGTTDNFIDCILNTGMIFVRGGTKKADDLWWEALCYCGDVWGDDQLSLAKVLGATLDHCVYDRHGLKVAFLPMKPWNVAPEHPWDNCSDAKILHFRGARKKWMAGYCEDFLKLKAA